MSILVFGPDGGFTYDGRPVDDVYTFLRYNQVDVVINQIAYSTELLDAFLDAGGSRWRDAGGHIISCLHFDPKAASNFQFFRSLPNKTFRVKFNLIKSALFYCWYKRRQEAQISRTYNSIYDKSDFFVTLSNKHFDYFKKVTHRDSYEKLVSINNPLTFDEISQDSILDSKRNTILICSRMDEYQKRILTALKVWRSLLKHEISKGWNLQIVGDGPDLDRYKSFVDKHSIANVEFIGKCNPKQYYERASIFMMTSIGIEGWGLTLTECLQTGVVPVVMNTCAVYSDIIQNGVNGFLTKQDSISDYTKHMLKLMSDPKLLREMQLNALHSASRFSTAATMPKWQSLLSKL